MLGNVDDPLIAETTALNGTLQNWVRAPFRRTSGVCLARRLTDNRQYRRVRRTLAEHAANVAHLAFDRQQEGGAGVLHERPAVRDLDRQHSGKESSARAYRLSPKIS